MSAPQRPLRVLFMHGLEGKPYGERYQQLCASGQVDGGLQWEVRCDSMKHETLWLIKPKSLKLILRWVAVAILAAGLLAFIA
jgi:hypothetical protein